jgi:ABC-type branched-subunit amino acid transport system substrate-binding protein
MLSLFASLTSVVFAVEAYPPLRIGMSAPFSGNAAQLGEQFRQGASLVIDQQNRQGGIGGRKIELISADDGYEPLRTVANTRQFVQHPQVFALFGYIGTPTTSAILPLLRKHQLPFIAAFTGADILRQPEDNFIFNLRASYREEAAVQSRYLIDTLGFKKIALLIQADEFGATLEHLFLEQLQQRQLKPVVIARFQRNSLDIAHAAATLRAAKPQLVLTAGTYQSLVRAIQLGQQQNFNPVYSVVSFSGVQQLQQQLKPPYQVYASMVLPDPADKKSRLVNAYHHALAAQSNVPASDIGLEGFAAATILVQALNQCKHTLTKTCLLQQLPKQQLYDFELSYSATTHQASQQIFLYRLTPDRLTAI